MKGENSLLLWTKVKKGKIIETLAKIEEVMLCIVTTGEG